ncbi:30S ribosomal protein S2 [Candidatus Burarchaeum australiense]|nr:30S ribosomal protein S2 [Candidatus Burarchaeum australiense]
MADMLLPQEKYLESGIHIGTKMKTPDMKKYIYKERQDKLYVLDLKQVDERIRLAARFIAQYDPPKVYVVASRTYAGMAAAKFAQITGCSIVQERFIPGSMTNPARPNFCEPSLLVVCDPKNEWQAIREATSIGAPVIALCDTDNTTKFIDLVVPCNNKGKKALALIFFLLAREVMKAKGAVASDAEFGHTLEEFDVPLEQQAEAVPAPAAPAPAVVAKAPAAEGASAEEAKEKAKRKPRASAKKKGEETDSESVAEAKQSAPVEAEKGDEEKKEAQGDGT